MAKFVDKELARIRALVGEKGQVLGAVSGGVDSAVAAKLMHEATIAFMLSSSTTVLCIFTSVSK